MKSSLVLILAIYLLSPFVVKTSFGKDKDIAKGGGRLPTAVKPEHYKLTIYTYLDNEATPFQFNGDVLIRVNVLENTKRITVHAKEMEIDASNIYVNKLSGNDTEPLEVASTEFDTPNEFFSIDLAEELQKGNKYEVHIPFNASLHGGLTGYYKSSYMDKASNKRIWLAVTQYEPTSARLGFPCFDEPAMKATFDISLAHHKNYTAISNMPLETSEDLDQEGWVMDHFQKTVPMSTYLIAYMVSDFENEDVMVEMSSPVLFKIWARRDVMDQVGYAKETGPKVLKFFENYFNLEYPLPKMDMVAIPDFAAGAMENWGLVTYRETALLFQPNVSSSSSKARVAAVISHELAHQWFGNLVTMEWWSDLWLNEGFATYCSSLGVRHLHPEWNSFDEDSLENTMAIFEFDALKSSHPVSVTVNHPDEISQIFDFISYKKGSSIIRMMHLFLGEQVFREGVSNYLKKFQYANAEQKNLWHALTESAHKHESLEKHISVTTIMDSWTLQTGYPVITVTRDFDANTAQITQKRYFSESARKRSEEGNPCWWVPLSYTTEEEADFETTQPKTWLECDDKGHSVTKTLDDFPSPDEWIMFNIGLSGLYKVQYDQRNWDLLIKYLTGPNFKNIGTLNRAQLVADALSLAWSGDQDYSIAIRAMEYLKQEDEYIPWKGALDTLVNIKKLLERTPEYSKFKAYLQRILKPAFEKQGGLNVDRKDGDSNDIVKYKVLISAWSCRMDVDECTTAAKAMFDSWRKSENAENNTVPSDLRPIVYCTAMRKGDENDWKFLWKRYLSSGVPTEQSIILTALGCSPDTTVLKRYLGWSLDESSGVKKQDSSFVFTAVANNDVGYAVAKSFLEEKIEELYKFLHPDSAQLTRYIKPITGRMKTKEEYDEFSTLVASQPKIFGEIQQGVQQAIETITINTDWTDRNLKSLGKLLQVEDE